ncbi:MAG TPA: hypothetical protein VF453_06655 [Burkholderiaceae bacterium]
MHYKDGREAKVGDLVKGKVYNTPGVVVGVMLGITPGAPTCNCRVGIVRYRDAGDIGKVEQPYAHAVCLSDGHFQVHRERIGHGPITATLVGVKVDYGQCDQLELVHRDGESPD